MNEKILIKCPYCGAEYVPSEIFYPEDFLPDVDSIVKDENGKIIGYNSTSMNLTEEYCCDICGHTFTSFAEVSFKSTPCEIHDFEFEHESKLDK